MLNLTGKDRIIIPAILVLSAFLLFINLGGKDYWSDEIFSLPKLNTPKIVLTQCSFDVHPPLFFLLEFYWIRMFGSSETATRSLPAIFALMGIITAGLIADKILPRSNLKLYLLLLAVSPFYLFYARMTRYYTLTSLLSLLTLYFFLDLLKTPKLSKQLPFWLLALLLIYTDYVGFLALFCLGLYFFWHNRQRARICLQFIFGAAVLILLYLPWISNLLYGAGSGTAPYPQDDALSGREFHLLSFIIHNSIQSAVRIIYTVYNFTLGETVYPWHPAIIFGVLGAAALLVTSLRKTKTPPAFWIFTLFLPFLLYIIAVVLYGKVFSAANFALLPSKIFFLQPLWLMFLLKSEKQNWLFKSGLALILVFSILSLYNYHRGIQYLNPKYQVPWHQIALQLQKQYHPGDLVVTDETPLLHYLRKTPVNCYGLVGAETYISELHHPLKVYLAIRHRGEESIYLEGIKLRDRLTQIYGEPECRGYVKIEGMQKKFWSFLLGKQIDYYLIVYTYSII